MNDRYFSSLLPELSRRATTASVSLLGFANAPLRKHLTQVLDGVFGQPGSFLADPAFEPVFGWRPADVTMARLSGGLLSKALVDAMDEPSKDLPKEVRSEYRFPKSRIPHAHQLNAWTQLSEEPPRSVVVTSGTGSGKTECFMVPILDALARERERVNGQLIGVRALFLYPLNALINSQRDRLRAWTAGFGSDLRFCLYNGLTPDRVPASDPKALSSEVPDRKTLRATPPPILVTNATMLEYMLVRTQDAPILEASQGKLQWIVLDEAHSYVGSQAAEIALLIRRVLHAFGVKPEQVRFVATSATIGDPDGEAGRKLRGFLAQIAGVDESRVSLVAGQRDVPELVPLEEATTAHDDRLPERVTAMTQRAEADAAVLSSPMARRIRSLFTRRGPGAVQRLSDVCRTLFGENARYSREQQLQALAWLDMLSGARDTAGRPFLPLRAHFFHQTMSGIWACSDQGCGLRSGALDDPEWPFGQVYLGTRQHCDCGAPVYEVITCDDCGAVYLDAEVRGGIVLQPRKAGAEDDFELDANETEARAASEEGAATEDDTGSPVEPEPRPSGAQSEHRLLIANREVPLSGERFIDRMTRRFIERGTPASVGLIVHEANEEGLGCPCCQAKGEHPMIFRSGRISAPYLLGGLLPTMLEYAPDADGPTSLPYRGRRILGFSDSRQGTARLAARLQQDAERTRLRGLVYHHALRHAGSGSGAEILVRRKKIEQMRQIQEMPGQADDTRSLLARLIADEEVELSKQLAPRPIPFQELRAAIAGESGDFAFMLENYREQSRPMFGGPDGASKLSAILLVREFGRRPKRSNNLETLGLVSTVYPKLEQLRAAPATWASRGLQQKDWRDFLKIALDFFVRGGFSTNVDPEWLNWLGFRASPTRIVSPKAEGLAFRQRYWASARRGGRSSTLVRIAAHALRADIDTHGGEDVVDEVLRCAWDELVHLGLLTPGESGFLLRLEDMAFQPMREAWVCPITRRFLDTTLQGVTPYLPRSIGDTTIVATRVELPVYDQPFGAGEDFQNRIDRVRAWLADDPTLRQLREEGVWSNLADRAIELAPYFRAAEHSAQQPAVLLDRYEKAFKEGRLNVLSCSTTMEMGIDIGGVQMVAMNNTPPHPANYLQRAGRAGRRSETRSVAVTLCKPNPHDQGVFSNTRWAFDTRLPAPVVSLDSAVIVQRHLNAMVLSQFLVDLLKDSSESLDRLVCGWFFVAESGDPPAARLIAWADAYESGQHPRLEAGLRGLIRQSVFDGMPLPRLVRHCAAEMRRVRERWLAQWLALSKEEADLGPVQPTEPAFKAIALQRKRMAGEYLLRELATEGFLPGYGFPSNIASFDNITRETAERFKPESSGSTTITSRDDNRFQRRDLASRDVVTALREYAPGSEIVMDGLVFQSAGITLNWHVPASEQAANEIQSLRFAWRCRSCGASGREQTLKSAQTCDVCGGTNRANDIQHYLEPAGFAVDFYKPPHNDVSRQSFIPVERPWINARGDWLPLSNPSLGRFRASAEGGVYHHSAGRWGKGYALCLRCGRAEPMTPAGEMPKVFSTAHDRLRGKASDKKCPGSGNAWAIKKNLSLGHYGRTDVLEIQLRDLAGRWIADRVTALTLAVALRDAIAALLGVQAIELGCDAKEVRNEDGEICHSILIFDRNAAGYASSATRFIDEALRRATHQLDCPRHCDSSCAHCILDFDQRFEAESLDRHAALRVLAPQWLDALKLPDALRFLGPETRVEQAPLATALIAAGGRTDVERIRLFLSGEADRFDLAASGARQLAHRIAGAGTRVECVIPKAVVEQLSDENRHTLASLASTPNIEVLACDTSPVAGGAIVLAEAVSGKTVQRWACADRAAALPDASWGVTEAPIVTAAPEPGAIGKVDSLDPALLRPTQVVAGDREISVQRQLDGGLQGFGTRFWDLIVDEHPPTARALDQGSASIVGLSYSDRYLFSPLTVALLIEVIAGLRERIGRARWADPKVMVRTLSSRDNNRSMPPLYVNSDWPDPTERDAVLLEALDYSGMTGQVLALDRQQLVHGRVLHIDFDDGSRISVRLDQGLGYWRVPRRGPQSPRIDTRFDFSVGPGDRARWRAAVMAQARAVAEMRVPIEGDGLPTELFVKFRATC